MTAGDAGPGRAWTEAAVATVLVAAVLTAWLTVVREPYDQPLGFLGLIWSARRLALAALQQLFLQLFFLAVLRELLRPVPAALVAAAVFGLCHLPSPALAIGDRVRLIPNHACVVTNLTDVLHVVDGHRVVETVTVEARGRNQ